MNHAEIVNALFSAYFSFKCHSSGAERALFEEKKVKVYKAGMRSCDPPRTFVC